MSDELYTARPTSAAIFDVCTSESFYVNNKHRNGFLTPQNLGINTKIIIMSEIEQNL